MTVMYAFLCGFFTASSLIFGVQSLALEKYAMAYIAAAVFVLSGVCVLYLSWADRPSAITEPFQQASR